MSHKKIVHDKLVCTECLEKLIVDQNQELRSHLLNIEKTTQNYNPEIFYIKKQIQQVSEMVDKLIQSHLKGSSLIIEILTQFVVPKDRKKDKGETLVVDLNDLEYTEENDENINQ